MPSSIASSYGRDGLESRRSSEFSIQTHETDSSSVGGPPCEYEDSWSSLKNATESLVDRLIRQRRQDEIALEAWSARCRTLEEEVARLADLLHRTEIERDAIVTKPPAPDRPSPGSPTLPPRARAVAAPLPVIDPTKAMSRQSPPPCNAFYLVGHCDVPRCRYEHRYALTPEQVEEMRRGAKHHVCNAIKFGNECPDGDACIFGHFCPRGPTCGRERCSFDDSQHRALPSPRPVVRRR
ncbi:hypothetical protein BMF94_2619 [Rhodotorula taiwanensis]|uniref:C3H1-type domain-containing protein n=1 Tax=Rhodotorula taiwanensis TaxID=741276 RepID=A0A2S5BCC3_9BASI|nr:hypothetical protein BMF94_2619 [Rhodotorula taiwanensis]